MSFLSGLFSNKVGASNEELPDSVRSIRVELDRLPEKEAQHLACFGFLMGRVAHADLDISSEEIEKISEILKLKGGLSQEKSQLVAQMIKEKNELFGATDNYLAARVFYDSTEYGQRMDLMRCLFMVSAADDSISLSEENELKKIAAELKILDEDYLDVRSDFREYREVLKGLRR